LFFSFYIENVIVVVYETVPGCVANAADIAPKYGGIIYGMANTVGNIPGFLSPLVAGILLQDDVRSHFAYGSLK